MKMLKPVEKIYHALVGLKNQLYDHQLLGTMKLGVPVVSVGNLSFGGVGKTPCIILLAEELSKTYRVNVITKSYKASLKSPRRVDLALPGASALFGDEACLISAKAEDCEVWSGPHKSDTALASLTDNPTLILLDDGFSHRKLARNFDLVLVDATEGLDSLMRESPGNIRRADAVLITKVNLAPSGAAEVIQKRLIALSPKLKSSLFVSSVRTELSIEPSAPLFVFCGIGRPSTFMKDLEQQGYRIAGHRHFADHHRYSGADQRELLSAFREMKKQQPLLRLITTEKDYVKINDPDLRSAVDLAYHRIEIAPEQKEVLLGKIRQSF